MTLDVYRIRLSCMMFGQYLILGSWLVTLATYLMNSATRGGLNFPPAYAGWIYSTMAFAGIIAPIFFGLLADRLFSAEKLMGCLHLLAALFLAAAASWCVNQQPRVEAAYRSAAEHEQIDGVPVSDLKETESNSPGDDPAARRRLEEAVQRVNRSKQVMRAVDETFLPLFGMMLGYSLCIVTSLTLGNVIVFRNLHDTHRSFGKIRLYGTVGWIVAGIQLELFWNTQSASPLLFAAAASVIFGLFCFSLPNTPPSGQAKSVGAALGLPALLMFRERSFRVLILCALGVAAVQQFYGVYANRFLTELHVPHPAAVQTIAQVAEVGCMIGTSFLLKRIGVKATIALGLSGWLVRNALFASESSIAIIALGLPMHGMSYAFFFMVASMYVDRKAPLHLRASAQGIFTFVSMGAGTLLGNWLGALVVQAFTAGDTVDWTSVWLVPTCMSGAILLVYLTYFRES